MTEEKHLDATPARIARARREGNVPRSSELVAAAAFGAAAIVAAAIVAPLAALASDALVTAARGLQARRDESEILALALLPVAVAALVATLAGVTQNGGVALGGFRFTLSRLDPLEGFRRTFSRETPAHALRAALAFCTASAAIAPAIAYAIAASASAPSISGVASAAWSGTRRTLSVACAVGLLFAAAEYAVLRSAWLRKLRMSVDELKREIKDQEGDPHARGRRKSRHRDLSRGAIARVREAAFVVTNPTHVAVALAYRPPEIAVPLVLVRAADEYALRVRERAAHWGVPVVEHPTLARTLYAQARLGMPIPGEHYVAVAEIVVALTRSGALDGPQ